MNDANLISAFNAKVIPAATYMNVCKFTIGELKELDQIVKRKVRSKKMLGKQARDERIYLSTEDGGRGLVRCIQGNKTACGMPHVKVGE